MSNLTPFEIRLELLKMAKDLLAEAYYSERDRLQQDWHIKVEAAKLNGQSIPDHPAYPAYPSEQDIIVKAASLNGFVSNNLPVEKPSKK
ncbi:hypothetical protein EBT25_11765 [bacterium]|nr:hypothetical protein [bacterium]